MAKEPAFLFYDGDAAKDVSHLNRLERGCYFDIIQSQRKFGRLSIDLIKRILGKDFDTCWEQVKICLTYENHMYYIEWLDDSIKKRKAYSESRSKNRSGSKSINNDNTYDEHMKTYDNHMEIEIISILDRIKEQVEIDGNPENKFVVMVVLKMVEIFKNKFPHYPVTPDFDYAGCLRIAYKIAEYKGWKKSEVINGRMDDCLNSWRVIVDFIHNDTWLATRSIPDISTDKEWARLVQKMKQPKKKPETTEKTAPSLTHLKPI